MPTIGSITKTVRINPNDLQVIEGIMRDGVTWSGAIHELCRGYTQKTSEGTPKKITVPRNDYGLDPKVMDSIKSMTDFFGISVSDFLRLVDNELTSGGIQVVDDGLKYTNMSVDTDHFLEACHDLNLDPQKTLEKLTESLFRTR